jgi:hypothetical protein
VAGAAPVLAPAVAHHWRQHDLNSTTKKTNDAASFLMTLPNHESRWSLSISRCFSCLLIHAPYLLTFVVVVVEDKKRGRWWRMMMMRRMSWSFFMNKSRSLLTKRQQGHEEDNMNEEEENNTTSSCRILVSRRKRI